MDYFKGGIDEASQQSAAAIQVGVKAGPDAEEARWALVLTIFFRVIALLWIIEGLEQWLRILTPTAGSFLDLSASGVAATIFFAVLDLVAAVGFWLVAPWGGVVWLLTLLAQIFVVSVKPSFFFGGGWLRPFDGALLIAYLVLSWRANVASGESGAADRLIEAIRRALGRG